MSLSLLPLRVRADRAGPSGAARRVALGVAGVALLTVGFTAGTLTARSVPTPPPQAPASASAAEAAGPVAPGPNRVVAGVPVGYARTPEGAVAAATGYQLAISDKRAFATAWRERAYAVMATPDAYPTLVEAVAESYDRLAVDLGLDEAAAYSGSVQATTVPLGYRLERYTDDAAAVSVWAGSWLTRPTGEQLPFQAQTGTVELVWHDSDWKLQAITAVAPLNPPGVAEPPTPDVVARMNSFTPYQPTPATLP